MSCTADSSHSRPAREFAALGARLCLVLGLGLAGLGAQSPAPGGDGGAARWLIEGAQLLEREDPVGAWAAFRNATARPEATPVEGMVGLGRVHLMLGRSAFAQSYGESALAADPHDQDAMALCVRSLIRARAFDEAVRRSTALLGRVEAPGAELLSARASALFRVQRNEEAATAYGAAVELDASNAEAHLRLGSGLLPPTVVTIDDTLRAAVAAAQSGDHARAIALLLGELGTAKDHPVAHRLLGEELYAQRAAASMAAHDEAFRTFVARRPAPEVRRLPIADFLPAYPQLSPARRAVVDRAVALFGSHLDRLVARGGSHDLLGELERTTDAESRSALRGRRTFDGRVWDDVRGIGGLQAATGIEALDEAAAFGFDTLAHEIAHQVHFHTFSEAQKARIKQLYQRALRENRCLDYYAASNDAEYFGQGVEAFASLVKRPGGETTHGHTRFELQRVDPDLHDFVAGVVDQDPLRDESRREPLLEACVAVALRCGRPEDAVVAARLLRPGPGRDRLVALAEQALAADRCH